MKSNSSLVRLRQKLFSSPIQTRFILSSSSFSPFSINQTASLTATVPKTIKFKQPILPDPELFPYPTLNRKWKRKLPKLLAAWEGEFPPPLQSQDPEIFAAQQRIFGYYPFSLEEDGKTPKKTTRKRFERWVSRSQGMSNYYPPSEDEFKQSIRKDLKHQKKALLKEGVESKDYRLHLGETEDYETALGDLNALLDITRYTQKQEERRRKIVLLRRRGRGPPKKGEGKRSGKGKKK